MANQFGYRNASRVNLDLVELLKGNNKGFYGYVERNC